MTLGAVWALQFECTAHDSVLLGMLQFASTPSQQWPVSRGQYGATQQQQHIQQVLPPSMVETLRNAAMFVVYSLESLEGACSALTERMISSQIVVSD